MNPHRSPYAPTIQIEADETSAVSRYRARRRKSPWMLAGCAAAALAVAGGAGFLLWHSNTAVSSVDPNGTASEQAPVELQPPVSVVTVDDVPANITNPGEESEPVVSTPAKIKRPQPRPAPPKVVQPVQPRPRPPVVENNDPNVGEEAILVRPRVFGGRFDLSSLVAEADANEEAHVTGALGVLIPLVEIPEAPVKLPLPKDVETVAAVKLIRDVYQDNYRKAVTPLEKTNLARFLLKQAADTQGTGHERFALLAEARDLALAGGSASTAMKMVDNIGHLYQCDLFQMKSDTLQRGAQDARSTDMPLHRSIAANSLVLIEGAVVAEKYEVANNLLEIAVGSARKARDGNLVKAAASIRSELTVVEQMHNESVAARAALANSPVDGDAHFKLGRYLCLVVGDWNAGLAHLAQASDAAYRAAAQQDTSAKSGSEQARAGDLWWDLAQQSEFGRQALTERARHWYQLASASGELSGLTKAKVASRLETPSVETTPEKPVIDITSAEDNDTPLAKKVIGRFEVTATERRTRRRTVSIWEFRPSHEALENDQVVARWELLDLNQVKITYNDEARGVVFLKANSNGPTGGVHTVSDSESWRWEMSALTVAAVWEHSEQSQLSGPASSQTLTFYSNGHVNNPLGNVTWSIRGRRLTINWNGMKKSVMTISPDGSSYMGETQSATPIAGLIQVWMVRGKRVANAGNL